MESGYAATGRSGFSVPKVTRQQSEEEPQEGSAVGFPGSGRWERSQGSKVLGVDFFYILELVRLQDFDLGPGRLFFSLPLSVPLLSFPQLCLRFRFDHVVLRFLHVLCPLTGKTSMMIATVIPAHVHLHPQ